MRPGPVAWERAGVVRAAARGWRRAGAIDEPTLRAVRETFPDPRLTPAPVWRALTAGVVAAVALCALGALSIATGRAGLQALLLLLAGVALVVTDLMEASPRFATRGAAGATSVLGVGFLLAGAAAFFLDTLHLGIDDALDALLVVGVLSGGASAWRWGSPLFAGLSTVSFFLLLARLPHGRGWWLLAGAATAGAAARRLDAARWAPSHRQGAAVVLVAGLGAVYAAVDLSSLDGHLLERFARSSAMPAMWPPLARALSAIATAVVPPAVLGWGLWSRRTLLLDAGLGLAVLSLATLRQYVHLGPLWMTLSLSGALLVGAALALERALRRAPAGEIGGFTADPLFTDERRQQALQAVPVIAAFAPAPPAPAAESGGATGEGRFGGGGASERF